MKLNAAIIYDFLGQVFELQAFGKGKKPRTLRHFEFLSDSHGELLPDSVYLAFSDRLPANPHFGSGVVLICVGGIPPRCYLDGRCVCLVVKESVDMFTVANTMQKMYDIFDEWEHSLNRSLEMASPLSCMLDTSFTILNTPMTVLDKSFKYLAISKVPKYNSSSSLTTPDKNGNVSLNGFSVVMEGNRLDLSSKEPYILEFNDTQVMCKNLFSDSSYIGSLSLMYLMRGSRESDAVLLDFLAPYIEKAIIQQPKSIDESIYTLKTAVQDLLKGMPYSDRRLRQIDRLESGRAYVCMEFVLPKKLRKAPKEFIFGLIEAAISESNAMEGEQSIIALAVIEKTQAGFGGLNDGIKELYEKAGMKVGVSNSFDSLRQIRLYCRQASIAIEYGLHCEPDGYLYSFSRYSLRYMLTNSSGEFPPEFLFPDGLKAVVERDKKHNSDYLKTLKAYLDNNQSISRTAEQLFLHRSSLLDRLERIQKLLNMDLKDPGTRLKLRMLIALWEINNGSLE